MDKVLFELNRIETELQQESDVYDFSCSNMGVRLYCDDEKISAIVQERLSCHFKDENTSNLINHHTNLFCKKVPEIKALAELFFSLNSCHRWKQIDHMSDSFFYSELDDDCGVSIWISGMRGNHKDNYRITDQLLGNDSSDSDNMCMIIRKNETLFFVYNNLDEHASLIPMRIIRSIFARECLMNKYIYYHAAAIRYKDKGILLCGSSGKGKTSLLLNFLQTKNGELIANDKVFIGCDYKNRSVVQGWPTVVTIGVGNLAQYPQLTVFLTDITDVTCRQDLYGYTPKPEYLSMTKDEMRKLKKEKNKLVISHAHLSRLFQRRIVATNSIDLVINVDLTWEDVEAGVHEIVDIQRKKDIIDRNIIVNKSDQLEWIGIPQARNIVQGNEILNIMLTKIPFYNYHARFDDPNLSRVFDSIV